MIVFYQHCYQWMSNVKNYLLVSLLALFLQNTNVSINMTLIASLNTNLTPVLLSSSCLPQSRSSRWEISPSLPPSREVSPAWPSLSSSRPAPCSDQGGLSVSLVIRSPHYTTPLHCTSVLHCLIITIRKLSHTALYTTDTTHPPSHLSVWWSLGYNNYQW